MKRGFFGIKKNNKGQVLVIVAVGMAVFLGFAAISVEYGYVAVQKRTIQNAADAAALAGAQVLYNTSVAKSTAIAVANQNKGTLSFSKFDPKPITPYSGDPTMIEVEIEAEVPGIFSKVWGNDNSAISARAVARQYWDGQGLPFLNIGYDYKDDNPILRLNATPGDKAQISDFYTILDVNGKAVSGVKYEDGIEVEPGQGSVKSNVDGTDLNSLLENIFGKKNQSDPPPVGTKYYLFSIKSDILKGFLDEENPKPVVLENGDEVYYDPTKSSGGFKNGDIIKRDDIVLLEVEFQSIKQQNYSFLELKFIKEYSLKGTDFPSNYISEGTGYSYLVE